MRRVMGIETEYGISMPGVPHANPVLMSGQVVQAYADSVGITPRHARWDYADETPLRDARGFDMGRAVAHPTQLTDEDPTLLNVVLSNGARLYVDHAHPEYSSPEVTTPRDAVIWDRAGELVTRAAAQRLAQSPPGIVLYKNNTDGKGASYGTHENYLMRRSTPFQDIVRHLIPFFVARQAICGSGRVGIGDDSRDVGYQLSQRADFFEVEVGLETTLKRPIINTRDEPHAEADRWRRLHVIIGDANHADVANLLKMGTTSLVLAMIEDGAVTADLTLQRPVATLQRVSHDPTLTTPVELVDGTRLTAVQLLWRYHELAAAYLDQRSPGELDPDTAEVMQWWERILTLLERDPMEAAPYLDWVGKLQLLGGYISRDRLEWGDPRLRAIDIQWSDVREDKGVFTRLERAGRFERLVTDAQIENAVTHPPEDTRAYFRGRCTEAYREHVIAASWDSVILDVPGSANLVRVPLLDPVRGTRELVGEVLDTATDVADLVRRLSA
ncbi:MAG: proteasome accessory factor PafA2 [Micrococcales bacterium]|nr:proteasome accessory factor PafA2 [Micrococcales bacterium]